LVGVNDIVGVTVGVLVGVLVGVNDIVGVTVGVNVIVGVTVGVGVAGGVAVGVIEIISAPLTTVSTVLVKIVFLYVLPFSSIKL
jgi:hypothetical protein